MYFLVVDAGDARERAKALASSYGGEMAQTSLVRFSPVSIRQFSKELGESDSLWQEYLAGMTNHLGVLHIAVGVSRKKDYGEIETTLKLMFGSLFLGRSRKRRDQ